MQNEKKKVEKIDFVLTWVDSEDKAWNAERIKYGKDHSGNKLSHYRDWGTLKYWFRGVEKYASWVNKIHFITCGQTPDWLNINHPKLNLVSHADYIPEEWLPTFSANPIELNFHRIKSLSEKFVYFNDDTFITAPTEHTDFFRNGLPCDSAVFSSLIPSEKNEVITYILFNDLLLINANFNKKNALKGNKFRWLSLKYGEKVFKNLYYLPIGKFNGFENPHLPNSFLKSTFEDVWDKESDYLAEVSSHKFREKSDVNQYLMRYWQLVKGTFYPVNLKRGKCFTIGINDSEIEKAIKQGNVKMLCINDNSVIENVENKKAWLNNLFDDNFSEKSSFEK